ncbi:MAG: ACT domain-containing protein [Candidatus Omnitrophota bacterium]|jgi:hypothetical protein
MKITQISVFLENKQGRLHEVCALLGSNNVNIRALTVADTEDFGILRIVVDRPQEAVAILRGAGLTANLNEIVAVEVEDRPGGLSGILKILSANGVNVEYMYGFVEKFSEKALLVFKFEEPDKAIGILADNNIGIVGGRDIKCI